MTLLLAFARWAHFASLTTVFGAECWRAIFAAQAPVLPRDRLPTRLLAWAAVTALASGLAWFGLAATAMTGGSFAWHDIETVAAATLFGNAMVARVALLALLVATSFEELPRLRPARIALSGAALAAIALTGHAAASGSLPLLRAVNDALHLLAAGFWIGGLAVLLSLARVLKGQPREIVPALTLFSFWGTFAVAALLIAGTLNAFMILWVPATRWSPTYITLLAAKIVLAAIMVSLALANRFGLGPALRRGEAEAEENLLMSLWAELAFGVLILGAVGFLGLLPYAR